MKGWKWLLAAVALVVVLVGVAVNSSKNEENFSPCAVCMSSKSCPLNSGCWQ